MPNVGLLMLQVTLENRVELKPCPYNGWPNYDTWNAALWMMNDESCYKEVYNATIFLVTQSHENRIHDYGKAIRNAMRRIFGAKTPDKVWISEKKSEVDWEALVNTWRESGIPRWEQEWKETLDGLPKNNLGGHIGVVEAAIAFRKSHAYR